MDTSEKLLEPYVSSFDNLTENKYSNTSLVIDKAIVDKLSLTSNFTHNLQLPYTITPYHQRDI